MFSSPIGAIASMCAVTAALSSSRKNKQDSTTTQSAKVSYFFINKDLGLSVMFNESCEEYIREIADMSIGKIYHQGIWFDFDRIDIK